MMQRQAIAGAHNTLITYEEQTYINFTTFDAGDAFTLAGASITEDVTFVSGEYFTASCQVVCDDTQYITDDQGNVYFLVNQFITYSTSVPNRA